MTPSFFNPTFDSKSGGSSRKRLTAEEDLSRKTRWLILWRLVFISSFLFVTVLLEEKGNYFRFPFLLSPLYFLVALQYFFSIGYLLVLKQGKKIFILALCQIFVDGLFVTSVVYVTGGVESFFSYFYFLVILAAGILFFRKGGIITAFYVGLCYTVLLLLQGWGKIPFYYGKALPPPSFPLRGVLLQIVMYGMGFLFVGFLSSIFAEQTQKQRSQIEFQKKNIDQLEELTRIVIENLDMGLIILDQEDRIQSINRAGEKILGRSLEDLVQKPLLSFFPDSPEPPEFSDPQEKNRLEATYTTPEGESIILGFSLSRVKKIQPQGIVKILSFKDISQIKLMEERLRQVDRLALMGKMAAGIAHEVRNPLASISGSIQVLKDDLKEKGTGERLLNIISREVSKLDSLINDFLAFTKPVQPSEKRLNISAVIMETIDLLKKDSRFSSKIEWKLDIAPDLFLRVSAGELSQILWNLLLNALQAVPPDGAISVSARSDLSDYPQGCIEIKIHDNGSGIRKEDQVKIFEPFFTTKDRGTGLGLSIVQKLVSDLGGTIRLESFPYEGTEFILRFPFEDNDNNRK